MILKEFHRNCRESFSTKVFSVFVIFITLISSVFTYFFVSYQSNKLEKDLFRHGEMLSSFLSYSSRTGVFAENNTLLQDAEQGIINQPGVLGVSIFNADKAPLLIRTNEKAPKNKGAYEDMKKTREVFSKLTGSGSLEIIAGTDQIEFLRPVILEMYAHPEDALYFETADAKKTEKVIGYVSIILDRGVVISSIRTILVRSSLIAMGMLLLGGAIIYFSVTWVTRPISRLAEATRKFGQGEYVESLPVDTKDEIGKLAITFNDMASSLRRRDEEKQLLGDQLRHAQKMEAIGTLAKGVAHDFNNILTTVKGSVYILQKRMDPNDPLRDYLVHIQNSVTRAKNLVQGLLAFSRGQTINPVVLDINQVIARMENVMSGILAESNAEYNYVLSEAPLIIMGDPVQLEQVLTNLATNARDAMSGGGIMTIETEAVTLDKDDTLKLPSTIPGEYASISVTDTGTGMDEKTRGRIFEPFFTTKEVNKGTGLGLSIIYGIIEQHHGFITVCSEKNIGSVFTIYIPLAIKSK